MVLKAMVKASFLYSVLIAGVVAVCLLCSIRAEALEFEKLNTDNIHCPQSITLSGARPDILPSLKQKMGFGEMSDLLIKKGKLQLTHDFSRRGHYVFSRGTVEKINDKGRISKMRCHYWGAGKDYSVVVAFASGFTYRLSNNTFGAQTVEECFAYDEDETNSAVYCSVSPFYTLVMNQIHRRHGFIAKLKIAIAGRFYLINAGDFVAVPDEDYAEFFLRLGFGQEYEVTDGCDGAGIGNVFFDPKDGDIYQLQGFRSEYRFERFSCLINTELVTHAYFSDSWDVKSCDREGCYGGRHERERKYSKKRQNTYHSHNSKQQNTYSQGDQEDQEDQSSIVEIGEEGDLDFRVFDVFLWYLWGASDNNIGQAFFDLNMWPTRNLKAVKKAYRAMIVKVHPDKPGGSRERFRKLQEGYELLEQAIKQATQKTETP